MQVVVAAREVEVPPAESHPREQAGEVAVEQRVVVLASTESSVGFDREISPARVVPLLEVTSVTHPIPAEDRFCSCLAVEAVEFLQLAEAVVKAASQQPEWSVVVEAVVVEEEWAAQSSYQPGVRVCPSIQHPLPQPTTMALPREVVLVEASRQVVEVAVVFPVDRVAVEALQSSSF